MELSVIIAAYNTSKYIADSLNSVVNSLKNASLYDKTEILVIDDGSSDQTAFIMDDFAKKNRNAFVIHKKNGGISRTRNCGLAFAKGKIISFVDSDDVLHPDYFAKMTAPIFNEGFDEVCCGMTILNSGQPYIPHPKDRKIFSGDQTILICLEKDGAQDFLMNKLCKRELFKDITFPIDKTYEDTFVQHLVQSKSDKTVLLNESLYLYRFNDTGITHNNSFKEHMVDFVSACETQYDYVSSFYPQYSDIAFAKYINAIRVVAWYTYRKNKTKSRKKTVKYLSSLIKQSFNVKSENEFISEKLRAEAIYLKKGYLSWNFYCKKAEFVKSQHNHPRLQTLLNKFFKLPPENNDVKKY